MESPKKMFLSTFTTEEYLQMWPLWFKIPENVKYIFISNTLQVILNTYLNRAITVDRRNLKQNIGNSVFCFVVFHILITYILRLISFGGVAD